MSIGITAIDSAFKKLLPGSFKPSIVLKVNGVHFENFISINAGSSMDSMTGTFDVVATIDRFKNFPIKLGNEVVVLVEGVPVITGFIEVVAPSYSTTSHQIRLSGRDRTGDVIDSSIIKPISFGQGQLRDIIFKLLNNNGIKTKNIKASQAGTAINKDIIGIIDLAEPAPFDKGDLEEGTVGQNMFEIINKYCMKRQVLATTDGFGNIVITRAGKDILPTKLIHKTKSNDLLDIGSELTRENNILSASCSYSTVDRFHTYIVKSQLNPSSLNSTSKTSSSSIVGQIGKDVDIRIRTQRSIVSSANTANTSQTSKERATWEVNVRRARSFTYSCEVQGFLIDGSSNEIWRPNKLVFVEDQKSDINAELLIKSVNYSFGATGGTITKLELIANDSFTVEANQTVLSSRVNKFGANI